DSENLAKNKIFDIYNNIKNNVYSFDYAVKNFSNDSYSHNKKGDLGWISLETLDKNFQNLLINLKNNQVSCPIKSDAGWHIIKLLNNRF
ncbi:peptidyl-prolyl cis-trans isomerase, partial [Buchnera aphidicola]|nr:peptidyl-prolyl cis-trans isomerase [Buchnera aphidicola]